MKYLFCFLFFSLIIYNHSSAQYSFKNQKKYKPFGQTFIDTANISSCSFSDEVIEFRFWKVNYTNTAHQLFIFRLLNAGQWELKKYSFCSWDWESFSNIMISTAVLSNEWGLRWDSLIKNQFLTIPAQLEVQKKWRASDGTVIAIADGHKYVIELLMKKRKRKYSYVNPELNLKHYDLGNDELVLINRVLKILDNELKFNSVLDDKCN